MQPIPLLLGTLVAVAFASSDWNSNFDERLITHTRNDAGYAQQPDDVTVLVPRPGAGRFVGFLTGVSQFPNEMTGDPAKNVSAFLGIPYAAKPTGRLRFRLPRPAYLDSRGRWLARRYGNACLQGAYRFRMEALNLSLDQFSEDCLYLNLFVSGNASEASQAKLPVLLNIHGGTLLVGGPHGYPGQVLASKGIVMATLSYRLNIFGLISTGTYSAPGNLALWDQRAALMWIRDSVEFFGGDPGRVTLSGESAGGSSVGLHIVSNGRFLNGGRPLFHQAVLMSGADIANWAVSRPVIGDHEGSIDYIAGFVGCSRSSVAATMSCLASVSAYEIDKWSLKRREDTTEPEWLWAPVVDGVLIGDIPLVLRKNGDFMKLPIMGGFTRDDTVRSDFIEEESVRNILFDELTKRGTKMIPGIEAIVEEAIKVYLQGKRSASSRAEMFQLMKNVTRDYEMIQPVYQALRFHANRQDSRQPVFLYEFGYEKRFQWPPEVRHGDDLDYILGVPFVSSDWWQRVSGEADLDKFNKFNTTEQRRLSDFMTTLWTNFVKFGNPTPTPVRGFKWDRLTPRSNSDSPVPCAILNLPELTSVTPDYKRKEMQLWKRFYDLELQYVLQLSSGESSGATSAVLLAIGSAAALLARLLA
ncbi:hypothetical protein BOX15_Mlig025662g2 [Macrostomum lignano]|uniref:Carboxylic ester hydrolase n=2 Tax=Macrostomum lignano TaxID=282301 RepID=A0A267H8M7_9PLAT|nr:hypothetical protein BOX15_Mlig025662g2 [Macrostomum lignano]